MNEKLNLITWEGVKTHPETLRVAGSTVAAWTVAGPVVITAAAEEAVESCAAQPVADSLVKTENELPDPTRGSRVPPATIPPRSFIIVWMSRFTNTC